MSHVKVGRAIVDVLKAEGVRRIFGLPGGHVLAIYDALYDTPEITHVLVRHEHAAACMAAAYAQLTGEPGVCLVTAGPGCTTSRRASPRHTSGRCQLSSSPDEARPRPRIAAPPRRSPPNGSSPPLQSGRSGSTAPTSSSTSCGRRSRQPAAASPALCWSTSRKTFSMATSRAVSTSRRRTATSCGRGEPDRRRSRGAGRRGASDHRRRWRHDGVPVAAEHRLPVTWCVLNDRGLGSIWDIQQSEFRRQRRDRTRIP